MRPAREEKKAMRKMISEPWDYTDFFKRRFPETFKEASECKNYRCIGDKRPSLDYIANNGYDDDIYNAIIVAARHGGLEEHTMKLSIEEAKALESGDLERAQTIDQLIQKIEKENGL